MAWAALTGLLIAVGVGVVHSSSVNGFDRHVTSVVVAHRTPALNETMKAVTWLGSWVALVATGSLLVVLALRRRLPTVAVVLAVIAWAGENGGVTLAKHVVERDRPPQNLRLVSAHGWSWPSGHTAVALLVFTTLALVVVAIAPRPGYQRLAWVLAALAVAAVAFSRVELGVHWTTRRHRKHDLRQRVAGGSRCLVRFRYSPEAHGRPRLTEATCPGSQAPSGCVRLHTGPARPLALRHVRFRSPEVPARCHPSGVSSRDRCNTSLIGEQ